MTIHIVRLVRSEVFMSDNNVKKFEDNLQELEAIVRKLEGEVPLDEAVEAFSKGIELSKACMNELKKEKGRLTLLVDDLNNITEEFDLSK